MQTLELNHVAEGSASCTLQQCKMQVCFAFAVSYSGQGKYCITELENRKPLTCQVVHVFLWPPARVLCEQIMCASLSVWLLSTI